jgi:membrane protein YdbS with pleckstrin-like domain
MDDWNHKPGGLHVEVGLLTLVAIAVAVAYIGPTPMNPTVARLITLALSIALALGIIYRTRRR